jgi:hypothetical protein
MHTLDRASIHHVLGISNSFYSLDPILARRGLLKVRKPLTPHRRTPTGLPKFSSFLVLMHDSTSKSQEQTSPLTIPKDRQCDVYEYADRQTFDFKENKKQGDMAYNNISAVQARECLFSMKKWESVNCEFKVL